LGTGDGQGILTTQFNYPDDASFTARMAVLNPGNTFNEGDFSAVWTTTFVPTAAGQWDFKFQNNDDTASIWVDKDQDGIFESSGAQGDERIADRGGCCDGAEGGWSGFTNGQQYLVGFAMSDGGGGGYLENVQFRGGGGAFSSYTGINPTGAGQSGLWSVVAGSPPNLLPIGTTVVMAASTTFDVNGAVQQIAALSGPANTSVTLGAGGNLTVSGSADASYGGVISGAGTLTKSGSNTLTLTGVNAHTVATVVNQGTLSVGADTALGATGSGGAKLKFTGGTLLTTASLTTDRPVEVSTGGGTFDSNGFNSTLSGAYSGTGSLTKDGVGTLSLTGTSTNTSAMNVNGGTLRGNTSNLKGNVVLANASNVAFDQSTDGTYTKTVSGAGNLTKEGVGVLTVQGTHTYIGDTMISGGTLKLAANPGFRYYRFQGDLSVDNNNEYQLSELAFYSAGTNNVNGTRRIPVGFSAQSGANYGDHGIEGMYDNNLGTKCFMNGNGGQPIWATFDFGTAFAATGYDWATANDSTPGRNPNNWTVYASNDNSTFTLIDTRTGQGTTPTSTFTWAAGWAINLGGGGSGSNLLPVGTTVKMASGTTLNLNNIDQQVGALADASGSPTGQLVELEGANLSIGDAGSAETTFSGTIFDRWGNLLEKNGTSVQNLNGAQQYDHLTVSGGTLNVNGQIGTDPANGTASVTVTGAGTALKFGSVSQTLSSLTIGAGATLTFGSGAASGAFSGGGFKGASVGGGSVVPEPGTIGLLLVGAIGVLNRRRRQG
jgi:fibronectin-binding autotransporter adhesin